MNQEDVLVIDPVAFRLFGFEVRWYGLLIAIALVVGILVSYWVARYRNMKEDEIITFAPFAIIVAVFGARIVHVLATWHFYSRNPGLIFAFRQGGLAIQGVVIGGFLALVLYSVIRKLDFWAYSDAIVPGLALAQAIGRWGNFFNQEAFGRPTDSAIGIYISPGNRPPGYTMAEYFHPTFLYESIANLILFGLLLFIHRFYKKNPGRLPSGIIFCIYLGVYSLYRIVIEAYRIDSTYIGPIKIVHLLSVLMIIAALITANVLMKRFNKSKAQQKVSEE
jgi:phosphatidylglycerol---prolipoprotein diacylglyceryl transferase